MAGRRRWWRWGAGGVLLLVVLIEGVPWLVTALTTVSTDDAYVNGHVTFIAPRVTGQVARVLVDDNNRVHTGDLLVELDKEPYQVELKIAEAAVEASQADLVTAQAEVRGLEGLARSQRFNLARTNEELHNQIAELQARVATLQARKATLIKAKADYERDRGLVGEGAVSKQEFDAATEAMSVAQAQVDKAQEDVYQIRAALGLPAQPKPGEDLAHVPADIDQTFSAVKEAQSRLLQTTAQLGVAHSFNESPDQMLAEFNQRAPEGNVDRYLAQVLEKAPAVKQAEAKLAVARANLDQAKLNLRYCDVLAEIDGVVTRRTVNPGDQVLAGENLMALRSLTDIWIDANFKETQLDKLRIGQPVDVDVDMYGSRHRFQGRVSGFTMGTGSTLALLPPQNATGNYVKVVQRLPVRIELVDYDPDKVPLFIGLSVTPYVHVNGTPTGPNAGEFLQRYPAAQVAAPTPEVR
ncbi:MAG TPA: HlyD family secretion protein [Deltaproteobacteria bacterium]|jgi:membrane fusion protein (multidrug efflux system)|nr:HlyD family secretion protein [Deltaproteobacteria bacterium]